MKNLRMTPLCNESKSRYSIGHERRLVAASNLYSSRLANTTKKTSPSCYMQRSANTTTKSFQLKPLQGTIKPRISRLAVAYSHQLLRKRVFLLFPMLSASSQTSKTWVSRRTCSPFYPVPESNTSEENQSGWNLKSESLNGI